MAPRRSLSHLDGLGAWAGVGFVLVAFAVSVRHGLFTALLLLAITAYPSLQFSARHYFHLEVVPVLALLVLVAGSRAAAKFAWRGFTQGTLSTVAREMARSPALLRVGGGVLLIVVLTAAPVKALRAWQEPRVERMVTATLRAPRATLPIDWRSARDGAWFGKWPDDRTGPEPGLKHVSIHYYLLEFESPDEREISVALRYEASVADADFSRVLSLTPTVGLNRIGFAAVNLGGISRFSGIELGGSSFERLVRAQRVETAPGGLPIDLLLPGDWAEGRLSQRLHREAQALRGVGRTVVCSTGPGCRDLMGAVEWPAGAIATDEITVHADAVRLVDTRIVVDGRADHASSYLFQLPEREVPAGSAFVAAGTIGPGGGVVVGLLREGAWAGQAFVTAAGPFVAVVAVERDGAYAPLVTNALAPGQRRNRLDINAAGFAGMAVQ